jgi:peptide/nickel transport system ATP-binding protein
MRSTRAWRANRNDEHGVMTDRALLSVENLTVTIDQAGGAVPIVSDLSFAIRGGETLCLVGESGCGKSMTALAILGLLPRPIARIARGRILLDGTDLTRLDERGMRAIRGNRVAMIFQEPMTSLNPVLTVGRQITEVMEQHRGQTRHEAEREVLRLLERVRIPDARRRMTQYPHQLSGGQRQRVMIAMALACQPQLLIADEPTTALDVTIQAQILALLDEIRSETGAAVLLITHDLGVVAEVADRVIVIYAGRRVEEATAAQLYDDPRHPYTRGLMRSVPRLGRDDDGAVRQRLQEIKGTVPMAGQAPPGCAFAPRCGLASDACTEPPPLRATPSGHVAACWHVELQPRELAGALS